MTAPQPVALAHTCFLVRDLEQSAQAMADALGVGPWPIWTIDVPNGKVHGKDQPFSFRVALATIGGGMYELISPLAGRTIYDEHLEQHGEGFHHTCLVYASIQDVRAAKAEFEKQGRPMVQGGSGGDVFDFGYYHFPEINSLVEVLYLDIAQMPPPEVVIQPKA